MRKNRIKESVFEDNSNNFIAIRNLNKDKDMTFNPFNSEEEDQVLEFIGYDDYEVVDYSGDYVHIMEFISRKSIPEMFEVQETIGEYDDDEQMLIKMEWIFEDGRYNSDDDIDEIIDAQNEMGIVDVSKYVGFDEFKIIGYQLFDYLDAEERFSNEELGKYFDYEYFGRDMKLSGEFDDILDEENKNISDLEFGEKIVDLMGGIDLMDKETLISYFDYEQLGKDYRFNGQQFYYKKYDSVIIDL